MEQTDFVCINKNLIIRKYVFTNEHEIPLDIKFLIHSKILSDSNNFVSGKILENGILQYSHEYNIAILSNDLKLNSHNINGADEVIDSGVLYDKDYIGMSNNSAISYEVGVLKPKEKKEFSIMIFVCDNKEKNDLDTINSKIDELRRIDVKKEYLNAKQYWRKYLKAHISHEISDGTKIKDKINNIYKRTILLYPLLTNARNRRYICCNGNR